jgi:hypothetical protein
MTKWLTEDATLLCMHGGRVANEPAQRLVTIGGRRVLVENDPEGRKISSCPYRSVTIKPCLRTLKVQAGYSAFVRVDGKRVCLETVTGPTEGTPPGNAYHVTRSGQDLVSEAGS